MGGVSYWLYDSSYNGETVFVQSGEKIGKKELLDDEGLVSFDFNLTGVRTAIKNHPDYISKNPVTDFSNRVLKMFLAEVGSASTEIMIKVTSPTIQKEDDIALHIPNHPVRYAPKRWFDKRSGVLAVPEGEYALSFSQTSHDTNPDSLNDRTGFLTEYSTSKTSMAVILDTVEKVINLYKYSRTRLFKLLVEARLSSQHTFPQAYQDIPWWFNFDETDPIDWSGSVAEIDAELERYLGLEEYHEYIQSVDKPFASELGEETLESPRKELLNSGSDHSLQMDKLSEWE